MSLGDRESYYLHFETNNLLKGEKGKRRDTHSDDLSELLIKSTENNNGLVVGQKRPITNNNGGNNTPAKVPCCQNLGKTMIDVEVDLMILNQVDQEHQILQILDDAMSERLASVIKKHWSMNQKNLAILKN